MALWTQLWYAEINWKPGYREGQEYFGRKSAFSCAGSWKTDPHRSFRLLDGHASQIHFQFVYLLLQVLLAAVLLLRGCTASTFRNKDVEAIDDDDAY